MYRPLLPFAFCSLHASGATAAPHPKGAAPLRIAQGPDRKPTLRDTAARRQVDQWIATLTP